MAWEKRRSAGATYFYLSRRDATGRVIKVYLGMGSAAKRAAAGLARGRADRVATRQRLEAAAAQFVAIDGLLAELEAVGDVLFEAFLIAEGFHRPNYGRWRRRRDHGRHRSTDPGTGG